MEIFFNKFDNLSNVRYLTIDSLMPDISNAVESLGEVVVALYVIVSY